MMGREVGENACAQCAGGDDSSSGTVRMNDIIVVPIIVHIARDGGGDDDVIVEGRAVVGWGYDEHYFQFCGVRHVSSFVSLMFLSFLFANSFPPIMPPPPS